MLTGEADVLFSGVAMPCQRQRRVGAVLHDVLLATKVHLNVLQEGGLPKIRCRLPKTGDVPVQLVVKVSQESM